MSELIPCPFCGSEYTQVRYMGGKWQEPSAFSSGYRGECCDCGATTAAYDTEAEAIAAWNTRAAYEMDGWFYLPKPKQQLIDYTTEFTFDDSNLKATGAVNVYALPDAIRKWQEKELNQYIVERICEVFKPERTCNLIEDEDLKCLLHCSNCGGGAPKQSWAYWNYCPNCRARITNAVSNRKKGSEK